MKILINCSNLKKGGGLQVGDSFCRTLLNYSQHEFWVVLSSFLNATYESIKNYTNVHVITYDIKNSLNTLIFGRDKFLDSIVDDNDVEAVLTVFGPSRWNPKVKHLSGFARAQLLMNDSPYYKKLSLKNRVKAKIINKIWESYFKRSGKYFFTENPLTSKMLQAQWPDKTVYTVTNYYNQIFDSPENWMEYELDSYDGISILTVSSNGGWKNLSIIPEICSELKQIDESFRFRFIITVKDDDFGVIEDDIKENIVFIGTVPINQLPSLYSKSDIMFMPSLMECFTATYPEAMRMNVPIVTTDLEFAKGLCGDAALFYDALNPREAALQIYRLAHDENLRYTLVANGANQLKTYDDYIERSKKLIELIENL